MEGLHFVYKTSEDQVSWTAPKDMAGAELRENVCKNLLAGFKPTQETVRRFLETKKPGVDQSALCRAMLVEHTSYDVANDMCRFLTACLFFGVTSAQFNKLWQRFEEYDNIDDDDPEEESLEPTKGEIFFEALGGEDWLNAIDEDITSFYNRALGRTADRVVWYEHDAFIDLVACKGDPGGEAIETLLFESPNGQWPENLGPGAPIMHIAGYTDVRLRDGTLIKIKEQE